ncbi:MAG: hydroxyacid dehydrogenase [Phycisphaerales bacterium]|nr:hydroxyacid dehydrogenase [Phycisphaerales bacterium]
MCEPIAPAACDWLGRHVDTREGPLPPRGAIEADGLVLRTHTRVDREVLDRALQLRVVGRAGVGLDNVDVTACRTRGVEVVYAPEANTQAVVEYTMTIVADALRPRTRVQASLDHTQWAALRAPALAARQMDTLVFGVLGCGRIGRRLLRVARSIGFETCYCDLREIPPEARGSARSVDARTLFASSDVVSIHVDGRASNRDFVSTSLLNCMKDNVILVNTSRGFVVDNVALAEFLEGHTNAQAHLDVHEPEPIAADNPLLATPNAWLYPHLAARTATALESMSWVVRDVVAVLEDRAPRFPAPGLGAPLSE